MKCRHSGWQKCKASFTQDIYILIPARDLFIQSCRSDPCCYLQDALTVPCLLCLSRWLLKGGGPSMGPSPARARIQVRVQAVGPVLSRVPQAELGFRLGFVPGGGGPESQIRWPSQNVKKRYPSDTQFEQNRSPREPGPDFEVRRYPNRAHRGVRWGRGGLWVARGRWVRSGKALAGWPASHPTCSHFDYALVCSLARTGGKFSGRAAKTSNLQLGKTSWYARLHLEHHHFRKACKRVDVCDTCLVRTSFN